MSQVKLTLRPPPNVDFVHGYPGIPPGAPDRPQAAVKGAIEVRTGPQGVKAKWVRVELRKVETLPGGGLSNTFYDFVGPSPVTLWTASDEYAVLRSQDFPFSIRIPESIPPSIALENRAGIKYELLASVCTKGKRGFLRRRKSTVISTQAPIIIDKHELHSTWPIYCQPETRQISHEGVTLTVDRNHTCYGPGDRISVMATLKSDSLHTILLRGFELTLKESTIFRAGPYTSGKKSVPQVRVAVVSESKLPVNFNLYGGMIQKAELTCAVSPNHTTTTLNTARHIDITYVLSVKAQLGAGQPIVMDLPVILSNWQRNVSHEAVRRIGAAPSLSLAPGNASSTPGAAMQVEPAPKTTRPSEAGTYGGTSSQPEYARPSTANTYHASSSGVGNSRVDDFGAYSKDSKLNKTTSVDDFASSKADSTDAGRRPGSAGTSATNTGSKFTIANVPSSGHVRRPSANATNNSSSTTNRAWASAEEEKQKLYESAIRRVAEVQSGARGASPPAAASAPTTTPAQSQSPSRWMSAEEEKLQLYNKAQAAAVRTQSGNIYSPQPQAAGRPTSAGGASSRLDGGFKPVSSVPQYPSAEEEKAALRRYQEAKQAVDRTQNAGFSMNEGASSPPPASDLPPPFEASASPPVLDARSALAEKERLRRAYEAQDAAAAAATTNTRQDSYAEAPAYTSPPPFPGGSSSIQDAISEKEMLRRKFEQQDAEALAAASRSTPPRNTPSPNQQRSRPTPAPPAAGGSRILTAAEEKAMLRARYEAETSGSSSPPPQINGYTHVNGVNGVNGSSSTSSSSSAPPPLMPRPPAEYIQETQEEDARVSRYAYSGQVPDEMPPLPSPSLSRSNSGKLDIHPFTPFSSAFDAQGANGLPPLPPKPPGE